MGFKEPTYLLISSKDYIGASEPIASGCNSVALSGISIDGFETFLREENKLTSQSINIKILNFYWIFLKLDGFKNSSLKIDRLG